MSGVDKAEIRRQMRRLRRDLSEEEQQRAADGVYAQVIRMDCYRTARTVMARLFASPDKIQHCFQKACCPAFTSAEVL